MRAALSESDHVAVRPGPHVRLLAEAATARAQTADAERHYRAALAAYSALPGLATGPKTYASDEADVLLALVELLRGQGRRGEIEAILRAEL
jgi:hypothetical protein